METRAKLESSSDAARNQSWYDEGAPNALMTAFEHLPDERYDAIIVDEGQDFQAHWWVALDTGLKPDGVLRVFYDSNQLVHRNAEELPNDVNGGELCLTRNLRNTEHIQSAFSRFYVGGTIKPSNIKGREVEWRSVSAKGLAETGRELSEYAGRLIADQGVPPGDIAVLVPNEKDIREITLDDCFGGCETTRCENPCDGKIVVDTIRKFKGLDSPVVLLAADQSVVNKKELPYVAMSRARVHLVVAGETKVLNRLRDPDLDTTGAEDL